jgi:hypothetical protein
MVRAVHPNRSTLEMQLRHSPSASDTWPSTASRSQLAYLSGDVLFHFTISTYSRQFLGTEHTDGCIHLKDLNVCLQCFCNLCSVNPAGLRPEHRAHVINFSALILHITFPL